VLDECGRLEVATVAMPQLQLLSMRNCRCLKQITLDAPSLTSLDVGPRTSDAPVGRACISAAQRAAHCMTCARGVGCAADRLPASGDGGGPRDAAVLAQVGAPADAAHGEPCPFAMVDQWISRRGVF
jgi:hypothetical protein